MPVAGDTFILTRQTGDVPHLWVLLWGPAGPADAFLAVHLSTWREGRDRSCLIQAGEHPFVQHETYVVYNNAKRFSAAVLQGAIAARQAMPRAPVSPRLLDRLRAGFFASPFTPHAMIAFAREEFGAAQ
jgi:hypothetical protein